MVLSDSVPLEDWVADPASLAGGGLHRHVTREIQPETSRHTMEKCENMVTHTSRVSHRPQANLDMHAHIEHVAGSKIVSMHQMMMRTWCDGRVTI